MINVTKKHLVELISLSLSLCRSIFSPRKDLYGARCAYILDARLEEFPVGPSLPSVTLLSPSFLAFLSTSLAHGSMQIEK